MRIGVGLGVALHGYSQCVAQLLSGGLGTKKPTKNKNMFQKKLENLIKTRKNRKPIKKYKKQ